jgi:hypothetical protein
MQRQCNGTAHPRGTRHRIEQVPFETVLSYINVATYSELYSLKPLAPQEYFRSVENTWHAFGQTVWPTKFTTLALPRLLVGGPDGRIDVPTQWWPSARVLENMAMSVLVEFKLECINSA